MPLPSSPRGVCWKLALGFPANGFFATAIVWVASVRFARTEAISAATSRSAARTAASRNVSPANAAGAWHIEISTAIATIRMRAPCE